MRVGRAPRVGWAFTAILGFATSATAEGWESPHALDASEQLGAAAVKSEHHTIEPAVESDGLINRYVIVSSFQRIGAESNTLALERGREQAAMAALREIKTTDAYKRGLLSAAEAPLAVTKKALTDPVGLVKSAPQALSNAVSDVSSAIGGLGKSLGSDTDFGDTLKQMLGYAKVKGRLAYDLGVDVHSANSVLQTDLDDVAWAIFAGGASIDLAMSQAPMAAGLSRTAVKQLHKAKAPLWDVSPATLAKASAQAFESTGLSEGDADELARHAVCTLTHQTSLASALAELAGVSGRDEFARHAGSAANEADCRRHVETARLLWTYHTTRRPVATIQVANGIVTLTDVDGRAVLPLRADFVFWTADAARHVDALPSSGDRAIWVSGKISARARTALGQRGIVIHEGVFARHPAGVDVAIMLMPDRTQNAPVAAEPVTSDAPAEKKSFLGGLGGGLFGGDESDEQDEAQ